MQKNLELVGAPAFDAADHLFARTLQHESGVAEDGFDTTVLPLTPGVKPVEGGSTDVSDVSHITPTVGLSVATVGKNLPWHGWAAAASHAHARSRPRGDGRGEGPRVDGARYARRSRRCLPRREPISSNAAAGNRTCRRSPRIRSRRFRRSRSEVGSMALRGHSTRTGSGGSPLLRRAVRRGDRSPRAGGGRLEPAGSAARRASRTLSPCHRGPLHPRGARRTEACEAGRTREPDRAHQAGGSGPPRNGYSRAPPASGRFTTPNCFPPPEPPALAAAAESGGCCAGGRPLLLRLQGAVLAASTISTTSSARRARRSTSRADRAGGSARPGGAAHGRPREDRLPGGDQAAALAART